MEAQINLQNMSWPIIHNRFVHLVPTHSKGLINIQENNGVGVNNNIQYNDTKYNGDNVSANFIVQMVAIRCVAYPI